MFRLLGLVVFRGLGVEPDRNPTQAARGSGDAGSPANVSLPWLGSPVVLFPPFFGSKFAYKVTNQPKRRVPSL